MSHVVFIVVVVVVVVKERVALPASYPWSIFMSGTSRCLVVGTCFCVARTSPVLALLTFPFVLTHDHLSTHVTGRCGHR